MTPKTEYIISAKDMTKGAVDSAVGGLNRLKGAGDVLGAGLSGLGGSLAAGLLGAGFIGTINQAIDSLDKMDESAEQIGATTEALSGLAYAGKQNGLEFDDMTAALSKLSVKMSEAAGGNKEAAQWFKNLGISVSELTGKDGKLIAVDEGMNLVADAFSGMEAGINKTALAVDGFGKSGAKMVPFLNQGAAGIKDLTDEGRALGAVIDGKLAKQAAQFNDNMDRLGVVSAAAGKSMTAGLIGPLNTISENLLMAIRNSNGFWESLARFASMNPFKDHATRLIEMRAEMEKLDFELSNDRSKNKEKDQARFDELQREIAMYEKLESAKNDAGAPAGGGRSVKNSGVAKQAKEMDDLLTPAAKEYAKAIEQVNKAELDAEKSTRTLNGAQSALFELMSSPEWAKMPETWHMAAIAHAELASHAVNAAEKQKRLNDMIAATPTAKLEESRSRMLELKEAFDLGESMRKLAKDFESGAISVDEYTKKFKEGGITAEQFSEAAGTYLGTLPKEAEQAANTIDLVISNAFDGAANAVADFVMTGKGNFGDLINSMVRDLIRLEAQMQMTSAFKSVGGFSGIMGSIGSWLSGFGGAESSFNATNTSTLSGSIDGARASGGPVLPGGTYLVGERGPELLTMGSSGGNITPNHALGGGNMTVNIIESPGNGGKTQRRTDSGGANVLDVFVEQIKGAIAKDIGSGGIVSGAMESQYGLNRAAGAWR